MPSEFVERARCAYAAIPVPGPPLDRIRKRVHRRGMRDRAVAIAFGAVLAVTGGTVIAAPGAGAAISNAIRVWVSGGTAAIDVRGLVVTKNPTPGDLASVAARATFPVVFPVALPATMRVHQLMFAPADHPTTITVLYASPTGSTRGFTLVDASTVNPDPPPSGTFRRAIHRWRIGREDVIDSASRVAADASIERAMRSITPAGSLNVTAAIAAHITNLGAALNVQIEAERRGRDGGVLIDPRHLELIPSLARASLPLRDDRTVTLTDIPRIAGTPDYAHAKLQFSRSVAISADGVKDVAAYLRGHRLPRGTSLLFRPRARYEQRIIALP